MKFLPANGYLRWLLIFLAAFLLLSVALVTALTLVMNTDNGSRWAVSRLVDQLNRSPSQTLSFSNSSGTLLRGMTLEQVSYQIDSTLVSLERLQLEWNPFSLLSGRLIVGRIIADDIRVEVQAQAAPNDTRWTMPEFNFPSLPFTLVLGELSLSNLLLDLGDNSFLVNTLMMTAELNGQELEIRDLHLGLPELDLDADILLQLRRSLPLNANVAWRYRGQLLQDISSQWSDAAGELVLSGDLASLQVQHQLSLPVEFNSNGEFRSGLLELDSLPEFDFRHETGLLRLPFTGLEETEFSSVQLLTAGSLEFPLNLQLQTQVSVSGLPAVDLVSSGQLSSDSLQIVEIHLNSSAGSLSGSGALQLQQPFAGHLDFSLTDADLLPYLNVSLPLRLSPVSVTGALEIILPETGLDANLLIESLNARLGDYPLTGSGMIGLSDQQINIENLNLVSDGTRLSVNGSIAEALEISWQLAIADLQQVVIDARGTLAASGRLQGSPSEPDLQLTATGQNLAFGGVTLAALEIQGSGSAGSYFANLTARAMTVNSGQTSEQIELLEIDLRGSKTRHQLNAELSSSYGNLDLSLQGGFPSSAWQDWDGTLVDTSVSSEYGNWLQQGQTSIALAGLNLELGNTCWGLDQTRLCLAGNGNFRDVFVVNASLRNLPLDIFNAVLTDADTDSMAAVPKLPQTASLQGSLAAELSVTVDANNGYQFSFTTESVNSVLTLAPQGLDNEVADEALEIEPQAYVIQNMEARGSGSNSEWELNANLDFARDNLDATAFSLQGSAGLLLNVSGGFIDQGSIRLDIGDMGWLGALIPEISSVHGQLHGSAGFTGEVTAPQLADVDFVIQNGEAEIPAIGIKLEQLNARLNGTDARQLLLAGSVRSDQGELDFNGEFLDLYTDQRELLLRVEGENILVLQREELMVRATPDLVVTANTQGINLSGDLHIPQLNLQLDTLPDTAVDVSRDTVIVSYPEERPDLARSIAASESTFYDLPVSVDLAITLGDQVNFSGFGLNARLTGALDIRQSDNGASLTYGELSVIEGTYGAYNTELTLERGKLLFFGAYDNPALDIRAVRQVEEMRVGLQINGTLKNISSQLYSSPALPDNDIIAVLITGRPFAEIGEQDSMLLLNAVTGLGLERSEGLTNQLRDRLGLDALSIASTGDIDNSMLTIGKYLSPSLFIRYGVGLFDSQSTVALDYKVSDSITLQAESGEYQSVDLIYRIER